jgi:hypothetical protein
MASLAVRLRRAIEAYHACSYFAPETRSTYTDRLGLHPWAAYFAGRAAPMGAVGAGVVTATFYGFSPTLVARSIPGVWEAITPEEAIADRFRGVDRALHRMLETAIDTAAVIEALDLARRAVAGCEFAGRPLAAATALVPSPEPAHLALWHQLSILREFRGDGHVAALVTCGVGPVESLVTSSGFADMPAGFYRRLRGWSEDEWNRGVESAVSRGWTTPELELTPTGLAVREEVEARTDAAMAGPLATLGDDGAERLIELVKPLSRKIVEAGGIGQV